MSAFLTYVTALPFSCYAIHQLENSNMLYYKEKNNVELKCSEMSSSYKVFFLMNLKPLKKGNF